MKPWSHLLSWQAVACNTPRTKHFSSNPRPLGEASMRYQYLVNPL
jgi:hypothetical protein